MSSSWYLVHFDKNSCRCEEVKANNLGLALLAGLLVGLLHLGVLIILKVHLADLIVLKGGSYETGVVSRNVN